jgi:hypothetical protein
MFSSSDMSNFFCGSVCIGCRGCRLQVTVKQIVAAFCSVIRRLVTHAVVVYATLKQILNQGNQQVNSPSLEDLVLDVEEAQATFAIIMVD